MLAPDVTTAQQQITDTFNSNASITAAVHSLENTVLQTLTPTPSWYTTINTALQTSQQQSMSWLLQTSPSIFATATQSYIDYANIFATTQEAMQNIVNQISTTPTAQQQALLTTFVQTLLNTAQKNLTACSSLQTQMTTFRTQMQTNQSTISTAVTAALADEGQIAAQIQATQTQIDSLMQQFTKYSTMASSSTISFGTSTFSLVISLTFGLALSGGTLGIATLAAAAISIGTALTESIIYTDDVKQLVSNISSQLETLGQEQVQLAMVQSVVTSLDTLMSTNEAALETFSDLTTIWNEVVDDLQWMLVVLAQPQIDITKIPALNSLAATNTAWQSISQFATQAQTCPLNSPPVVQLPQATIPQAQAA